MGARECNRDKDFVEPFVKKAKDSKITIDELGDYLYAKHAPERNAKNLITPY